jgi:small-conductance mechanosensitive channel
MFKAFDLLQFEADKGTGTGDATGTNSGQDDKPFATFKTEAELQAAIDNRVKDRLERAQRQADEKAKEAAEKATADALKANSQYKELSEKQATDLLNKTTALTTVTTDLDTVTKDRDKYKNALEAHVKERCAGLPDHITALLDVLDPLARLDWLTKNAAKLGGTAVEGVPATPKQQGGQSKENEEEARARARQTYQNRF